MPIPRLCAANVRPPFEISEFDLVDEDFTRFPLADVLWTLAMALDTYLVVFYHFDAHTLHKLETKYIAAITTLTFIPAFIFLFINTPERGSIYGSQTVSILLPLMSFDKHF